MNSTPKAPSMSRIGNRKGFTLIEMAIVLVIIGIIIGAVVKGQDLIKNAQAKQLTTAVTSWRTLTMAFFDRNGRLPGDEDRSGLIADHAATETDSTAHTAIGELVTTMQYAPANPVAIGGMQFWIYIGNTTVTSGTRNAMLICGDSGCANALSIDQIEIVKALDTSIDGVADAKQGQLRSVSATPTALVGTGSTGTGGAWTTGAFTGSSVVPDDVSATGTAAATPWTQGTIKSAVWLFDRTF